MESLRSGALLRFAPSLACRYRAVWRGRTTRGAAPRERSTRHSLGILAACYHPRSPGAGELGKEARTVARKDQQSSKEAGCDICGASLDDDAVIQEFPDGSVVRLCSECAEGAVAEDEDEDFDLDDATAEWAGPDAEHHSPAEAKRLEPEVFEPEEDEEDDQDQTRDFGEPDLEGAGTGTGVTKAEAELAAWANSSAGGGDPSEEDVDLGEDFDEEEAEEATLQLMAAIAEADMAEDAEDGVVDDEPAPEGFFDDVLVPAVAAPAIPPLPPLPPLPVATAPAPEAPSVVPHGRRGRGTGRGADRRGG